MTEEVSQVRKVANGGQITRQVSTLDDWSSVLPGTPGRLYGTHPEGCWGLFND